MAEQRGVPEVKYDSRLTAEQKEILITIMAEHTDFARGKLLGVQGRKTKNALWEILATQLNACGAEKTTAKWLLNNVWTDLKNKVKRKASEIKRSRSQTGGGPPTSVKLTPLENQIVEIITEEAVHGLPTDEMPLDTAEVTRSMAEDKENVPPTMEVDHDYVLSHSNMSPPSPSASEALSDVTAVSSGGSIRRRLPKPTTAEAVETFAALNADLNAKINVIGETLNALLEERRQTNGLLRELVDTIKQKML